MGDKSTQCYWLYDPQAPTECYPRIAASPEDAVEHFLIQMGSDWDGPVVARVGGSPGHLFGRTLGGDVVKRTHGQTHVLWPRSFRVGRLGTIHSEEKVVWARDEANAASVWLGIFGTPADFFLGDEARVCVTASDSQHFFSFRETSEGRAVVTEVPQ